MAEPRRICVFCGSSPGARPEYVAMARDLGTLIAERGFGLVYGGSRIGLMGEVAAASLRAGGEVIGVIPRALAERDVAFDGLPDLRVVGSMHERKALMASLSDAFVALPGGFGTVEELAEVLTWSQLGVHAKPCALLNVLGYFDRLLDFIDHAIAERFVHPANRSLLLVAAEPADLLDRLFDHQPRAADKATWALGLTLASSADVRSASAVPLASDERSG